MRALPSVLVLLALSGSSPGAYAFFAVASDGRASVRELEAAVVTDGRQTVWALRASLDGSAEQAALIFALPSSLEPGSAKVLAPDALAALELATSPRLVEVLADDPCIVGTAPTAARTRERRALLSRPPLAGPFALEALDARGLESWLARWRLTLSAPRLATLLARTQEGARLVALRGPLGKKVRGRWTPWISLGFRGAPGSLPIGLATADVTPGRVLELSLYAVGPERALVPAPGPVTDVPTRLALPEVALEDPEDLVRAVLGGVVARERGPHAVRVSSERLDAIPAEARAALTRLLPGLDGRAVLARYAARVRADVSATLALESAPGAPHAVEWRFRRVWRAPVACDLAARYLAAVRIQQATELRTLCTVTGRPFAEVLRQHQARGYGERADGSYAPVVEPRARP